MCKIKMHLCKKKLKVENELNFLIILKDIFSILFIKLKKGFIFYQHKRTLVLNDIFVQSIVEYFVKNKLTKLTEL